MIELAPYFLIFGGLLFLILVNLLARKKGLNGPQWGLYLLMTWGFLWIIIRFGNQVYVRYFLGKEEKIDLQTEYFRTIERMALMSTIAMVLSFGVFVWVIYRKERISGILQDKLDEMGGEKQDQGTS